jgi:1-deoxy-D-xylulose-5-phosphate reductoisomerase
MPKRPKRIAVLGSTGSIGTQALRIIAGEPSFSVCALAAGRNWRLLAQQARLFRPQAVVLADASFGRLLKAQLPRGTRLICGSARFGKGLLAEYSDLADGQDAMSQAIMLTRPDLVVTAVVGAAGLGPTLTGIRCGCDLAIANKESLVMAGGLVVPAAKAAGVRLLPVDSEHSALFQCLQGQDLKAVRRVILTASGGPLRTWSARRIARATLSQVLRHPTWRMGRKITVDSATLMNKAFEVIEAHWLFGLAGEQIEIVVHPESLVHGCVEFSDGSMLAQMNVPSMATPISVALHHPARSPRPTSARLDLAAVGRLNFAPADPGRFPAAGLGHEVIRRGGTAGAVLNAANEVAVAAFLAGKVHFGEIVPAVREVLNKSSHMVEINLRTVLQADAEGRRLAREVIQARRRRA